MPLASPTVHLNGTSKAMLVAGYTKAMQAVDQAITALAATQPHERDYYVQTPNLFNQACDEHKSRMTKLAVIRHELEELALNLL